MKLESEIMRIFRESRGNYGTRKIRIKLRELSIMASRRKIDQIMAKYNLVSSYIKHHPKRQRTKCNEDELPNIACEAFSTIPYSLNRINIFHTDRGNEFKNKLIDSIIETFNLKRSLSAKGAPLDNTVIESTNHILKTEFIKPYGSFSSLEE